MNDEFEAEAGLGIFAGDAIRVHDTAKTKTDPSGVIITAACVYCGRDNELTAEWPEVITISCGAPPPNWFYDRERGMIRPNVLCPSCNRRLSLGLTPDECLKHLKTAVTSRVLDGNVVEGQRQQVMQHMQGMQQRR